MEIITCPHCGASNSAGGAYCESCGKALPAAAPSGPRVVDAATLPMSVAGQSMVSDQLTKQVKTAANALLFVAIVQLVCGGGVAIAAFAGGQRSVVPIDRNSAVMFLVIQLAVSLIFFALYFWARRAPLPATIVGLVLYSSLIAVNVVTALTAATRGDQRGFGGAGIGLLDIVIIVLLSKGISAALKHRKLIGVQAAN